MSRPGGSHVCARARGGCVSAANSADDRLRIVIERHKVDYAMLLKQRNTVGKAVDARVIARLHQTNVQRQ